MLVLPVIPREVAMHRAYSDKFSQDTPTKIGNDSSVIL